MDDLFGTLIVVLFGGGILWRVVSRMMRSGGPSQPRAPSSDDQYEELRGRVEQRRREIEEARQQTAMERPDAWESYADVRDREQRYDAAESLPWGEVEPPSYDAPAEWSDPGDTAVGAVQTDEAPAAGPPVSATPRSGTAATAAAGHHPRARSVAASTLSRRNLRRAILAQEILGRPLSLRPPGD